MSIQFELSGNRIFSDEDLLSFKLTQQRFDEIIKYENQFNKLSHLLNKKIEDKDIIKNDISKHLIDNYKTDIEQLLTSPGNSNITSKVPIYIRNTIEQLSDEEKSITGIIKALTNKITQHAPIINTYSFCKKNDLKNNCIKNIKEKFHDIRNDITRYYYINGYINSGAKYPTCINKECNKVKIEIIEGKIAPPINIENEMEGKKLRISKKYLLSRFESLIADKQPLNTNILQNKIDKIMKSPCIDNINVSIKPGREPGLAFCTAKVKESYPIDLSIQLDNQNPPTIGAYRYASHMKIYNPLSLYKNDGLGFPLSLFKKEFGFGDVLDLEYTGSYQFDKLKHGLDEYYVNYSLPINKYDTKLSLNAERSISRIVVEPIVELGIISKTNKYLFSVFHPIVQNDNEERTIHFSLERYKSKIYLEDNLFSFLGAEDGITRASIFRLFYDHKIIRDNYIFSIQPSINIGLDMMGSSIHGLGPDGNFLYFNLFTQSISRLDWFTSSGSFFLWKLYLRFSENCLIPTEKFSIGGFSTVRGYREGRLSKDNGIVNSFEFRVPIPKIKSMKFCIFFDYGWGKNTKDSAIRGVNHESKCIYSCGTGLRLNMDNIYIYKNLHANFYYGIPLKWKLGRRPGDYESPNDRNLQDDGFHFQFGIDVDLNKLERLSFYKIKDLFKKLRVL